MRVSVSPLLAARPRYWRRVRSLRFSRGTLRRPYQLISAAGGDSLHRLKEMSVRHPRISALVGASSAAVAAGTVYAVRHHPRSVYADALNDEQPYRVCTLDGLREPEHLALIQRELAAEWGPFGPQSIAEMSRMAANAGRLVFVIRFYEDGELGLPSGVLQTALVDAGGDPERLKSIYPSFDAVTSAGTWTKSPMMRGDTALLLQITALGERSRGVGSRLRDTALYMLPPSVRYALTTTPVPNDFDLQGEFENIAAVRFHLRGGAQVAGYGAGFKDPAPERAALAEGRQSNRNVVFLRYSRNESGEWEGVSRPDIRIRRHPIDFMLPNVLKRWQLHRARVQTADAEHKEREESLPLSSLQAPIRLTFRSFGQRLH